MTRLWCFLAAILAPAALSVAADGVASKVRGVVVDSGKPAMYRLPPVGTATEVAARRTAEESSARAKNESPTGASKEEPSSPAATPRHDEPVSERARSGNEAIARRPVVAEWTESRRGAPRMIDLTTQLLPAVQRGFGLAQRGALYAARTELVQVLRRVAQAHDAASGTSECSQALAAGLRALDEANDFVPEGVQLEAEVDVRRTASSHRTNVLPAAPETVSPSEAVALYHAFAREQLRKAVAGEQAGSMALYGLGTIDSRLAERSDDDVRRTRSAMTMYWAALDTCPNNHLAANELGVLVFRGGDVEEAAALFMQAIDFAPSAVAYHNLAIAQQRGGRMREAAANEVESQRLAALERTRGDVSRRAGVHWVTPAEMSRATQPIQQTGGATSEPGPPQPPPKKSAWQRMVDSTKALSRPGGREKQDLGPAPAERMARPTGPETVNQNQWR